MPRTFAAFFSLFHSGPETAWESLTLERKAKNLAPDAAAIVAAIVAVVVVAGILAITLIITADKSLDGTHTTMGCDSSETVAGCSFDHDAHRWNQCLCPAGNRD